MKKSILLNILLWTTMFHSWGQIPYDFPFCPLDTHFTTQKVIIPTGPLQYDILCTEDSMGYLSATDAFAKLKNDFQHTLFIPDKATDVTKGSLIVTQNVNIKNATLGDGGGTFQIKVQKNTSSGKWEAIEQTVKGKKVYYRMIDFSPIGGAVYQKSLISRLGLSTLFVTEGNGEDLIESNTELSNGFSDVSDYVIPSDNGTASDLTISRYQNMNWVAEINPKTTQMKATQKWYGLGRGSYTDIVELSSTDYLMVTGVKPSVILLAQRLGDIFSMDYIISYYKQTTDEIKGEWIMLNETDINDNPIALSLDDLLNIHKKALEAGATMFNNLSKMAVFRDGASISKIYLTERGTDNSGDIFSNTSKKYNGVLAQHLKALDMADGTEDEVLSDPYGRVLELDPVTWTVSPFIEGGPAQNCRFHFSNPDGIGLHTITYEGGTKSYLVIHENILGVDQFRNPDHVISNVNRINETYVFDLANVPSRDHLRLLAIGPRGAEITGFSDISSVQDGKGGNTFFVTLKYPNPANEAPFNKSMVLAVSGLYDYFANPTSCAAIENDCEDLPPLGINDGYTQPDNHFGIEDKSFKVWPNPVRRTLYLNEVTGVAVYDHSGQLMFTKDATSEVDIMHLKPGIYFIQNTAGQSVKLVVE